MILSNSFLLDLTLVAVGGAVGGIGRFWVSGVVTQRYGDRFPWGTLVVNASGAASIGIVAGLLLSRGAGLSGLSLLWAGLVVGMLGSYTTVSSFSLQTLVLVRSREHLRAVFNVAGSLVLCIGAATVSYLATLAVLDRL
jgi:fluoride exporter